MTPDRMRQIAISWSYDEVNLHNTYCAVRDAIKEDNTVLNRILYDLEYAAYNLLDGKSYADLPEGITESTGAEDSLLIAIRNLKTLMGEGRVKS